MILSKLLLILFLLKQAPQVEPMHAGVQLVFGGGEILVKGLLSIGGIVFGSTVYDSESNTRKESIFQKLENQNRNFYNMVEESRAPNRFPPGYSNEWRKVRGEPAWLDPDGNKWKEDQKHKGDEDKNKAPHYDVSDPSGKKIKEVTQEGVQIWPNGSKNRNKGS